MNPDNQKKPDKKKLTSPDPSVAAETYPLKIPESQGDLADRADVEIEQEMQELIWKVQQKITGEKNEKTN